MVSYSMQPYYRQASLTVDTAQAQQKYFEEDDSSILDDAILDHSAIDSGLEMSPQMIDSRRDSFAVGSSLFSPKQEDWQSVDMQSVPSNNPFMDPHSNNPFMRLDQHQQAQAFAQQPTSWPMTATSSSTSATPMAGFDGLPAEFDPANASIFHRPSIQSQSSFSNQGAHINMFSGMTGQSIPSSPQKDPWTAQNQAMSKKMRSNSPAIRSHNELRRGDGIRKKNARFDIPAERNLSNIDQLIAQSTDEQEIKELKQQKRLLRNRQAALDSRQRKKQHTERLEDEKKHYTQMLGDMEEKVAEMEMQMAQLMRDNQGYQEYVQKLNLEKEEMIREHTIETGELRKKIGVLTSHVQQLEGNTMPTTAAMNVPQNPGFPGPFGDMDGLAMDGGWDNMGFMHDFPLEQPAEVKQELQMVPTKKNEVSLPPSDSEKPANQGGLLFMLFLVGAFVLSSRQTPSIPRVSEDVRAASKTLLDNVLKDAGVPPSASAMAPQPSGPASWGHAPAAPMMTGLDGVAPSMLGDLSDSLTRPTQQQTNEQLFSLSAAQYNGVNSQDFLQTPPPERAASQGRRNLADALASMRTNNKADVYTRSLLWDQIPSDVVRTFAKMVAECNTRNGAEQACNNEAPGP